MVLKSINNKHHDESIKEKLNNKENPNINEFPL